MYFLYASIFFALGIISIKYKKKSLTLFLIISCAIPSSFAFEKQVSLYGFYFFEHFYWAAIPVAIATAARKGIPKNILFPAIISAALTIYIAITALHYEDEAKYIIREFRLAITLIAPAALILFFRNSRITRDEIVKITFLCATFTLLSYSAGLLGFFEFKNEYYNEENRYRYFAAGTYLCSAFLIFSLTNKHYLRQSTNFDKITILLCAVVVLISGYRVLIVALALGVVISTIKNPTQALRSTLISASIIFVGIQLSFALEIERVTSALSAAGALSQLNIRYGPAFSLIESFSPMEYLFGAGVGTTFEIPWFEYQGLDTKHNMVDSTYLTLFVKFGAASILYLAALISIFTVGSPQKTKIAATIFLSIMMLTFPISYHPTLILLILPLFIMNKTEKYNHER